MTIKKAIKKNGKTQIEVAKVLGIRPDSLSTAIARKTLNVDQLEKIAGYLSIPMAGLFDTGTKSECPHCKKQIKITIEK